MKINLSYNAHCLLKHILTTTGEKEIGQNGMEILSLLRLNDGESKQRRLYFKSIESFLELIKTEAEKISELNNKGFKEKNLKTEEESDKSYEFRILTLINNNKEVLEKIKNELSECGKRKFEIDLNNEIIEVIKKYFKQFGDKNGWTSGDDEIVEEILLETNKK